MNCQELASRIEKLQPQADARDVARLCLLISNFNDNLDQMQDHEHLSRTWQEMSLRIQAAADQHAAMTQELEDLARSDPEKFNQDQVWVLLRAIKVQSQVLQLYVGHPVLDV